MASSRYEIVSLIFCLIMRMIRLGMSYVENEVLDLWWYIKQVLD